MIVYLGFAAFAVFGYICGRIVGVRVGHKRGMKEGRRIGTYWERRGWLDSVSSADEIEGRKGAGE